MFAHPLALFALLVALAFGPAASGQHLEFPRNPYYTCVTADGSATYAYYHQPSGAPRPAATLVPKDSAVIAEVERAVVQLTGEARTATEAAEPQALTGTVGVTYASTALQSTIITRVGVGAASDEVTDGFGARLRSPGQPGAVYSGYVQWNRNWGNSNGLYVYGGVDAFDWAIPGEDPDGDPAFQERVSSVAAGLGRYWNVINGEINEKNEVRITGYFGPGIRVVGADGGSGNPGAALGRALGSGDRSFVGADLGLTLTFNSVQASVTPSYYLPFDLGGDPVSGLSGLQIAAGIKIRGDLFTVESPARYRPARLEGAQNPVTAGDRVCVRLRKD